MGKKIKTEKTAKMLAAEDVLDELNALFEEDFEPVIVKRERAPSVVYSTDTLAKLVSALTKKMESPNIGAKIEDGTYAGIPYTTATLLKAFKPSIMDDDKWYKREIAVKDESGEKTGTMIKDRDSIPTSLKEFLEDNNILVERIKGGDVPAYWVNIVPPSTEDDDEPILELDESEDITPEGVTELEGLVE